MKRQQRVAYVVALVVIGVWGLASPELARDCLKRLDPVPGVALDEVAVLGDHAYLVRYDDFRMIDVSEPTAAEKVGLLAEVGGVAVAVSHGYAYAEGYDDLHVIDVDEPAAREQVNGWQCGLAFAAEVSAGQPKHLDAGDAIQTLVPWAKTDGIENLHGWLNHECCDCGLAHTVLFVVTAEGLRAFWWVDSQATRRARAIRGLPRERAFPDLELDQARRSPR